MSGGEISTKVEICKDEKKLDNNENENKSDLPLLKESDGKSNLDSSRNDQLGTISNPKESEILAPTKLTKIKKNKYVNIYFETIFSSLNKSQTILYSLFFLLLEFCFTCDPSLSPCGKGGTKVGYFNRKKNGFH